MIENPFEIIMQKLLEIEKKVNEGKGNKSVTEFYASENLLTRKELCKKINVTEPTVIRWEHKGKIPSVRIGSCVRYDWNEVIKSLSKNNKLSTK